MHTSVTVFLGNTDRAAREAGNVYGVDRPITDDTPVVIALAEGIKVRGSIGQWRALVADVEAGIAAIPVDRAERARRAACAVIAP